MRRRRGGLRRRVGLVFWSMLTIVALAAGGWLLDPAGSRDAAPASEPVRTVPGSVLYAEVVSRMVAGKTATYTFSGSAGGGEARSGSGSLRFLADGEPARAFDGSVMLRSNSTGQMRAVLLPGVTFLAIPPAKGIPRSKPWLRVTAEPKTALGRELGPLAEQLRAAFDPGDTIGLLKAADRVEVVGPDSVEGTSAVHHRAIVRLHRALAVVDDPTLKAQFHAMLTAGVTTLRYELWLDSSSLPLRVRADVPRAQAVFSLTGVFRRWGDPVRITAPQAKQVFDADRIKG
jgi:hypothetical protein